MVKWPRLPLDVLKAAIYAYISPQALYLVGREWGVEAAFEPTLEVDAGLLQFKRLKAGEPWGPERYLQTGDETALLPPSHRKQIQPPSPPQQQQQTEHDGIPLSHATANFVKSLFGAIYLHESPSSAHQFFRAHIISRHLDVHKLFSFSQPTRHLSRLCAREGFDAPVARLLAETGRHSRTPVYIVGAYSGHERLGEGYGASLDEARIRAAVSALKAWYLYSPTLAGAEGDVPSRTERVWGPEGKREGDEEVAKGALDLDMDMDRDRSMDGEFKPPFVDVGEVIV